MCKLKQLLPIGMPRGKKRGKPPPRKVGTGHTAVNPEKSIEEQNSKEPGVLKVEKNSTELFGFDTDEDVFYTSAQELYTAAYQITLDLINNPLTEHLAHIRTVTESTLSHKPVSENSKNSVNSLGAKEGGEFQRNDTEVLEQTEKQLTAHQLKRQNILVNSLREYMKKQCDLVEMQRQQYSQYVIEIQGKFATTVTEMESQSCEEVKKLKNLLCSTEKEKQKLKNLNYVKRN